MLVQLRLLRSSDYLLRSGNCFPVHTSFRRFRTRSPRTMHWFQRCYLGILRLECLSGFDSHCTSYHGSLRVENEPSKKDWCNNDLCTRWLVSASLPIKLYALTPPSVIVASAIRLFTLPGFGRTSDPTWTNAPTTMWSAIELGVGIVCASIPGIYSGLRYIWPAFRNFTRRHISMRGSKPTDESEDFSYKKKPGISGVPRKGKYHKASLDLFATENFEMDYKNSRNSMDKLVVDMECAPKTRALDLNKPHPPLPREAVIERSTTITVIRGPRSGWGEIIIVRTISWDAFDWLFSKEFRAFDEEIYARNTELY